MTDSRFKFLIIICSATIIAGLIIWRLTDPRLYNSKKEKTETELGKYVYVDDYNLLHTDRRCSKLNFKGMVSERHNTDTLNKIIYSDICPNCVNDKQFEVITGKNGAIRSDERPVRRNPYKRKYR